MVEGNVMLLGEKIAIRGSKVRQQDKDFENSYNPASMPFVSIVIVNYNCSKNYLSTCLRSLEQINYPKESFEVLIVDNSSTDDSVDFIRKKFPWVRIYILDRNYGQMPAVNRGATIAKGEAILVLDADTRVTKNWIPELAIRVSESNL